MTGAAALLRDEIARAGPVPFSRFMEVALYHPEHGYYCGGRDPFGKAGDFYTAEQLQPVFGRLIAAQIESFEHELGDPPDFTVVELGAGRAEMAPALSRWRYVAVEAGGDLGPKFTGAVFANEFFDALPVETAVWRAGACRQMRVGYESGRFVWIEDGPAAPDVDEYLRQYVSPRGEGEHAEANLEALRWLERIAARLERGFVLAIDYGYTTRESVRFPQGTLMSYRRHAALEDVLEEPGARDITAHVCFTALERQAQRCGFELVRFESLARTLLRAGERDQFAAALAAGTPVEQARLRLQLKTLLFSMGESFRTLLLRKG